MSLPALDRRCALFLDVDGTLLQIADRPQDVRVDGALLELLVHVNRALGGAMALVSGRALRELDALMAPLMLPASGQHGGERRDAQGRVRRYANPAPAAARGRLAALAATHPGLILEDKGASLALHYRLAPHLADRVNAEIQALAQELAPTWEAIGGRMVSELKPAGLNKGVSIGQFMTEPPFRGRLPIFIGDDVTDEDGFERINRLGGCSVKVGEARTCAQQRLGGVAAVRAWLSSSR